jgi:hypothetical protein
MKRALLAPVGALIVILGAGAERLFGDPPGAIAQRGEAPAVEDTVEQGLVGHWKLQGDCRDYSGLGNHGVNHGVDLDGAVFDGTSDSTTTSRG